jgi:transposase-like protein
LNEQLLQASKLKARKEVGAICPRCLSADYVYIGRKDVNSEHHFKCNSCLHVWKYGFNESKYTELK